MRLELILTLVFASLAGTACSSTSVRTFNSPMEATAAIVESVDAGQKEEASRIFNSFARASVQRDRVYAELFGTAETRYMAEDAPGSARILEFVCAKYPAALNAHEGLVHARIVERAETGQPNPDAMQQAVDGYRRIAQSPSAWADLAETRVAIDRGNYDIARARFSDFLANWDAAQPEIMWYVEEIGRNLESN